MYKGMKNKLFVFGASMDASFSSNKVWSVPYMEWKGYIPKVYGEFLSEMLGLKLINCAVGGTDNYTIFEFFCNKVSEMVEGDTVVIGWTEPARFRLAPPNGFSWCSILPNFNIQIDGISNNTLNEILVNRMHDLYWMEIISWSRLIQLALQSKGISVIFYSPFQSYYKGFPKEWYIHNRIETITMETDGKVINDHYSERGHNKLANIFYDRIKI